MHLDVKEGKNCFLSYLQIWAYMKEYWKVLDDKIYCVFIHIKKYPKYLFLLIMNAMDIVNQLASCTCSRNDGIEFRVALTWKMFWKINLILGIPFDKSREPVIF